MSEAENLVVFVTAPEGEAAVELARQVVGQQLAACVNLVPALRSIYFWEGAVQDNAEQLLIIKTTGARYPALEARIKELHPYTVPEIIALPIVRGQPDYLQWLQDNCRETEPPVA